MLWLLLETIWLLFIPTSGHTVSDGCSSDQHSLPFSLTIRVRIPLKPTIFSVNFALENNENKLKMRPDWPIKKYVYCSIKLKNQCKKQSKATIDLLRASSEIPAL